MHVKLSSTSQQSIYLCRHYEKFNDAQSVEVVDLNAPGQGYWRRFDLPTEKQFKSDMTDFESLKDFGRADPSIAGSAEFCFSFRVW